MFPNILTPSPLYQSMLRSASVGQQPSSASTSFLVENLLRDRGSGLVARPLPGTVPVSSSLGQRPADSQSSTSSTPTSTPYLKFGVNAILSPDTPSKTGKFGLDDVTG